MVKSILVDEKPILFSLPRPNRKFIRASKGIAGSLIFHSFVFGIGFSVAFQIGQPKSDTERSTFRWEVSLSKSPLPEPVTSDTPNSSLSAPALKNPVSPFQHSNRSTLAPPRNRPVTSNNESRKNSAMEFSVQSRANEGHFGKRQNETVSNNTDHSENSKAPKASISQQLTQEMPHRMPFTNGQATTLPPPIDKVVDHSEQIQQPSILEEPRVLQRPRPYYRPVRSLITRPNYGWLIDDLRTKLEKLKFYPQTARMNKWEGKVIVQMKILADGDLIDAMVEESSGFDVLDQAALAIIREASPLELEHPLLAANVILSVPLTFQLE